MSEKIFNFVCSTIEDEKDFLNSISQQLWKDPELAFKEFNAHEILTSALIRLGFQVEKNYVLPTAFKAVFSSKNDGGPVMAVLLEYDALPDIGHACGHNLIAEAGLAASLGIKAAMEDNSELVGKLVVLGTPAEENGGGKIQLLKAGVFDGIDAAMMVHPAKMNLVFPTMLSRLCLKANFKGKEAHAAAYPWEGRNALDAAISAYQNISHLRQQIRPTNRIHAIITKGGTAPNIIPADSTLEIYVRALTKKEMDELLLRVKDCLTSGATSAGCSVTITCDEENCYENLLSNAVMGHIYKSYAEKLGLLDCKFGPNDTSIGGSTDMGNVSHVVPSIHPEFYLSSKVIAHTKEFTEVAGSPSAQTSTLAAAKAMAMTVLNLMHCPDKMQEVKMNFQSAITQGY